MVLILTVRWNIPGTDCDAFQRPLSLAMDESIIDHLLLVSSPDTTHRRLITDSSVCRAYAPHVGFMLNGET